MYKLFLNSKNSINSANSDSKKRQDFIFFSFPLPCIIQRTATFLPVLSNMERIQIRLLRSDMLPFYRWLRLLNKVDHCNDLSQAETNNGTIILNVILPAKFKEDIKQLLFLTFHW